MKNDKRIRLTIEEIQVISKALEFYAENCTEDMPERLKEAKARGEFTYYTANTLGLNWRFSELATGSEGRARKRFLKKSSIDTVRGF